MKYLKISLFLVFLLISNIAVSQTDFHIEGDYLLFEDAKTGEPVLVYNDSMAARGFDFKEHFKVSFPDGLKPSYFTEYQYQINDVTYLVDNGGGIILKFEDKTFKRIDKSFRHRNQYGAIPFAKDSTIYLYGGYGLFTFKNILTTYNLKYGEWYSVQMNNHEIIPPSSSSMFIEKENELFFFAGFVEDGNDIFKSNLMSNHVWCLNFDTLTWRIAGNHNLYSNFENLGNIQKINVDGKLVLFKQNIAEIDINSNRIEKYLNRNHNNYYKIIYHPKTKMVSYIFNRPDDKLTANSELYNEFRGSFVSSTSFYQPFTEQFNYSSAFVVFSIILVGGLLFLNKRKKGIQSITMARVINYDSNNDSFSYKGKTIDDLSQYKKRLLKWFIEHNNSYILLNDLDTMLFEQENNGNNFSAIKKRRELLIKEIKNQLSLIIGIDKDKIFSTRKNELDKRIKEIKLNIEIKKK